MKSYFAHKVIENLQDAMALSGLPGLALQLCERYPSGDRFGLGNMSNALRIFEGRFGRVLLVSAATRIEPHAHAEHQASRARPRAAAGLFRHRLELT